MKGWFVRDFRDLEVWKKSIDLTEKVYIITKGFPDDERYGLTSQLRRAAVSVSSNISEGCGRRTSKDFTGFLHNAFGSIKEIECQLIIANRLGYLKKNIFDDIMKEIDDIGKMLRGFINHVNKRKVE
jgi:four helix bundle protein